MSAPINRRTVMKNAVSPSSIGSLRGCIYSRTANILSIQRYVEFHSHTSKSKSRGHRRLIVQQLFRIYRHLLCIHMHTHVVARVLQSESDYDKTSIIYSLELLFACKPESDRKSLFVFERVD